MNQLINWTKVILKFRTCHNKDPLPGSAGRHFSMGAGCKGTVIVKIYFIAVHVTLLLKEILDTHESFLHYLDTCILLIPSEDDKDKNTLIFFLTKNTAWYGQSLVNKQIFYSLLYARITIGLCNKQFLRNLTQPLCRGYIYCINGCACDLTCSPVPSDAPWHAAEL